MLYYTLKVVEIRPETSDTVTLVFKQPALKKLKYEPGQYLTLIFRINGRRYIRPYSFSSAPLVDSNIEVTVKRVSGGIVSNHIIDKVQIGDMIEAMEPLGDFTLNNEFVDDQTHIVLWGAGSGITPLVSIAKYALHTRCVKHVTLVYGNRTTENVIFKNTINQLKLSFGELFSPWHFYTQFYVSADEPYVVKGRIDAKTVLKVMGKEKDLSNTVHYICGPAGLKESIKETLKYFGINDNLILSEDFEIERDAKLLTDVITRNVILNCNGQSTEIKVIKGKSILEAGLDALLELDYSCQTGNCKLCKARINKGEVKMVGVKLQHDELKPDECLMCCSFPLTESIELSIE
ncbi:ferredoxin--NADP reductase [Mucilaginibacter agri]|uniref:2Fe-2S iron-sulfur cluster binding domain-containing protein n=1 Tax=Mucilaginibacter agri TaxID=2695265 RepID=A0A965ZJA5_9SPHI|nr:ferredoxin--NADP reductase [Mucilaginibacter agri]NCD70757.1 2Fe-2S iron-sulfur cluster binding domain-containing protein [Mucilaginibacter agri]